MKKIEIFQVDAFAEELFQGNPAAVCLLDGWLEDGIMQKIAEENNLAETAFIVKKDNHYEIRWFTPTIEVELCGHATLASAFVIFEYLDFIGTKIDFHSPISGALSVVKNEDKLFLDFPIDTIEKCDLSQKIKSCIGILPIEVYKGKTDYIAVVETQEEVANLTLNLKMISELNSRGLIVTAKGEDVDFVSRFFAPQSGIDEDPVTGSAHTSLIPIWANKLNCNKMMARQLSKRGGKLICELKDKRCSIGGTSILYLKGNIYID